MSDLISREDAIKAVAIAVLDDRDELEAIKALPSADAEPKWNCTANFVAEQLEKLKDMTDEERIKLLQTMFPSAEAVQGWRTGKPTKGGKYIVTLIGIGDYRFVDIMHYDKPCMPNIDVSGACWYRDDDEWGDVVYDDSDVVAWMPLPKPYKGGDTE